VILPILLALASALPQAASREAARDCALRGQVVDQTGAPLPGVTVAQDSRPLTTTNERGEYCVATLAAGKHRLVFSLAGFGSTSVTVDLAADTRLVQHAILTAAFSENVVVTGTRTRRLLDTVPVRTEVIDRGAIAATSARTLADAVEFTTGVRVENNCQNCNFSQIRLLGLEGPYTQILVDGQPIISSLAQVYGIEQIPARMIERIEVVKGGGSSLYGAGAVGGIVNIIPREAIRTSGVIEARSGQGGFFNGALDWVDGGRQTFITGFAQLDRLSPRDVDDDGFTDVSRRHLGAAGLRANRLFASGRARLTLDYSLIHEDRRGGDQLHLPPHEATIAEAIDSERHALSAGWSHGPSARFDYRFTLAGASTDRHSYYGAGRDPNAYGETSSTLALADAQFNHYLGPHILSWGGQLSRDRMIDRQPAYGRQLDLSFTSRGLFLQDDWTIRRGWQLLSGVRADWHSALSTAVVSPRVALMITPIDPLDIRVSIARGFRAPQVFDEDLHLSSVAGQVRLIHVDPGLREERATGLMAGFEWKPVAGPGQAMVEANVFRTRLVDLFHAIERDDPATPPLDMLKTNLGGATVEGIEMNLGWGMGDELVIQGGVVHQRAVFDDPEPDFDSREFFRTPRRYGNVSVRWNTERGWEAFAGVRVTGSMKAPHYAGFIPQNRLETTPRFTTIDLSIGRRFAFGGRTLTVTASARNIGNSFQRDLDRGPLRDAAYVYGPRFPRSLGLLARVEF
jgi:outer membrane receptor for ferrienterochelin and colicins